MMPRTTIFNLLAAFVLLALIFTPSHVSAKPLKIIAFGDSLTAGYRLDTHEAFPAQLERALRAPELEAVRDWFARYLPRGLREEGDSPAGTVP